MDMHQPVALPRDMGAIKAAVCSQFGVSMLELISGRRSPHLVRARHAAFWLARLAGYLYPEIGEAFGRHPTSVMRGVSRALLLRSCDPGYAATLAALAAPFGWTLYPPPAR